MVDFAKDIQPLLRFLGRPLVATRKEIISNPVPFVLEDSKERFDKEPKPSMLAAERAGS
jgi:hypothetical protein